MLIYYKIKTQDMKYAVIAALLATASAKTQCKKGLGVKVFSDKACKNDAHEEHVMVEEDIAKTGTCESHKATEKEIAALSGAKETLVKS